MMTQMKKNNHSKQTPLLLTGKDVAAWLNVSTSWVWDHTFRREPYLPCLRLPNGRIRYRASEIEVFVDQLPSSTRQPNSVGLRLVN